jgi:hypothetical protein
MWYTNLEKSFTSRNILHQHWYPCPIALPVRRNPQHRSVFFLLSQSEHGDLAEHHLRLSNVLERTSRPSCESLYATDTSQRKQETFLYEYPLRLSPFAHKKTHNRTFKECILFCISTTYIELYFSVKQKKLMFNFYFISFKLKVGINHKNIQNTTRSMF